MVCVARWARSPQPGLGIIHHYNRRRRADAEPDAVEGATVELPQGAATEVFFHDMRRCGNQPPSAGLSKSKIYALTDVRPWPCRSQVRYVALPANMADLQAIRSFAGCVYFLLTRLGRER